MSFVLFFLVIFLIVLLVYGIISFLPKAASPAEKLVKQQGRIANTILGEPTGEETLPLELQQFEPFQIKGNYVTDIFTLPHNDKKLFSFLLHGKTFHEKWSLSNILPGMNAIGQTHLRCWLGKLPVNVPEAEVFYRHAPQDIPPFCSKDPFSCGNETWDKKYVFAGNPQFASYISPAFIDWLEKNRLYVMISSGWMLLVDAKETTVPNDKQSWKNQMQDMSAWTSLQDILIKK